ncbi:unnamed protein product [Parnassius mnemosyne]|uniref:THAP-type domain-containing protein n=1 Tax=Parnassius mnemosyne TaxID=213953 RepID=A0AAV1L3H1_9NEOP
MPSCAVKWCGKHSKTSGYKKDGITFHRFPKIPELKEKWIDKVNRENWFPTKYSAVCSRHFTPDCFEYLKERRRLFSSAIPTLFLPILDSPNSMIDSYTNVPGPSRHNIALSSLSNKQVHSEAHTSTEAQTPLHCFPFDDSNIFRPSHDYEIPSSTISNKEIVHPVIEDLTPRKRKMKRHIDHLIYSLSKKKKEVKRLQDKNRLLVKKNANLKEILNTLTKKSYITQENQDILSRIGVQNQEIVKRQILKSKKGHIPKIKYSPELRAFSLTLHFYSPKAYNFVRQTFSTCLPATSTLRSWYQSIDGKPGFTKEAIDTIKMKARESKNKIYATIIFVEMAIKSGVEYHPQARRYYGHVSFGASLQTDCQDEAKEALVFLLVPINASWKIPIGYFLINGINAEQKAALLTEAIHLIEEAGVNVKAITFDGCPANITMAKKLGCSFEVDQINTTFKNPCKTSKIAVFLDPAHMIKLVRNAFEFYRNLKDERGNIIFLN